MKKKLLIVSILFLLFSVACLGAAVPQDTEQRYDVGYRILDLPYGDDTMTVAVWYPTRDDPEEFVYGGSVTGNLAVDGAFDLSAGPYPLMVFSHGFGGGGIGAAFFTEALASHGWVVAAPDHHDFASAVRIRDPYAQDEEFLDALDYVDTLTSSGPNSREDYLYRLDEMRFVLDSMLASEEFSPMINETRVAVGGHSFGGFTAMGVSGTIPEYHDERIQGVLLFSTGAGNYLFTAEELGRVNVPLMVFMGEKEGDQTRDSATMLDLHLEIYDLASPPKYFVEIKNGTHFSFNEGFKDTLLNSLFRGTSAQHAVIADYAIAFLETHVAERTVDAVQVLNRQDRMVTEFLKEE